MDDGPIVFEDWERALRADVPSDLQRTYREAIVKFRYWLRQTGRSANTATFKEHLAWKQSYLSPERFAVRREALRWYYKAGRNHSASSCARCDVPEGHPPGGGKGAVRQAGLSAYPPPLFCDPSAGQRCRHPRCAGSAWACRRVHDANLPAHRQADRSGRPKPVRVAVITRVGGLPAPAKGAVKSIGVVAR